MTTPTTFDTQLQGFVGYHPAGKTITVDGKHTLFATTGWTFAAYDAPKPHKTETLTLLDRILFAHHHALDAHIHEQGWHSVRDERYAVTPENCNMTMASETLRQITTDVDNEKTKHAIAANFERTLILYRASQPREVTTIGHFCHRYAQWWTLPE